MEFDNNFFKKVEKKTNVSKETIVDLAKKLQTNGMKDEKTIREVIDTLSKMTNRKITPEKEDKIIKTIIDDKVPTNVDKMF